MQAREIDIEENIDREKRMNKYRFEGAPINIEDSRTRYRDRWRISGYTDAVSKKRHIRNVSRSVETLEASNASVPEKSKVLESL